MNAATDIAQAAAGERAFRTGSSLLFGTVEARNAAADALEVAGFTVERSTAKFPGRPVVKPSVVVVGVAA